MRTLPLAPSSLPGGRAFGLPALLLVLLLFPEPASGGAPPHAPKKSEAGSPPLRRFYGRLESLDLSRHPMTLSAIMGRGPSLVFLFGGVLVPDTMVFSGGRTVGVRALKTGADLEIDYRETPKGALVQKIFLLSAVPKTGYGVTVPSPVRPRSGF